MKYKIAPFFDRDYPITQRYGENRDYYAQFSLTLGHEGIDYGTPNGTPVLSPFDGVILRDTFNDKSYGNFSVVWDKEQQIAMWFCHLQDIKTSIGANVVKGQLLGHTNNTGNSSGPHCHVDFVETDEQGNRLNKDNGNQGFLDLLAYADIGTSSEGDYYEGYDLTNKESMKVAVDVMVRAQKGELVDKSELDKELARNKELQNQINDKQGQVDAANAEISHLKDQLANLPQTPPTDDSSALQGQINNLMKVHQAIKNITYDKWSAKPLRDPTAWQNRLHQQKSIFEKGI